MDWWFSRKYDDQEVIYFVAQTEHQINPAPVIFAETFRSLNHCRTTGEGRFLGCAQLLCMWMLSHIRPPPSFRFPGIKFTPRFFNVSNPLREFALANWNVESQGKAQRICTLQSLTDDQVIWKATWMPQTPVLYRCGSYPWVILLGLFDSISYAPARVRRQGGPHPHDTWPKR